MNMLSIKDVAEVLRISTKTVYRLINQGAMQPVKIGRVTRIEDTDLQDYIQSIRRGRK